MFEKLKSKPEKERKRLVLFFSVFITLLIIAFWAISLPQKLSLEDKKEEPEISTPTGAFLDILKSAFNSIKKNF